MKRTATYSLLVNFLLFAIILIFSHPIYNTDEDVYVAYFLGGGFGPPTALLHYNYGMHPVLGLTLKTLTGITINVNWYTISLFAAHFISCVIIFNQILKTRRRSIATIAYLTLFILIETKFLLVPNFSNTSVICACAAATILLKTQSFIPAILMLLLGSMFRIHPLIPVAGITMLFSLTSFPLKKSIRILGALAIAAIAILGLNIFHQSYYKANIPNWKAEENYRQHIYKFYNHQITGLKPSDKWYQEVELINNGMPFDTNYLSIAKLDLIIKETAAHKNPVRITSTNLYWFWMEYRILIVALICFLLFGGLNRKQYISVAIT
ncbi:MAG TPA: hypothetical protein VJT83_04740, partial [Chitinophagaceae bacterium]|nr:hypothetical protein [Chitinophagaceae bacterium]